MVHAGGDALGLEIRNGRLRWAQQECAEVICNDAVYAAQCSTGLKCQEIRHEPTDQLFGRASNEDLSMLTEILTVGGARPPFIKAAPASHALSAHGGFRKILVHTGQYRRLHVSFRG